MEPQPREKMTINSVDLVAQWEGIAKWVEKRSMQGVQSMAIFYTVAHWQDWLRFSFF